MGQEESAIVDDSVPPHSLAARTLSAVAEYIKSGHGKRIVVLTGAGISTAAGIPDFRSPKTGLYNNLARLDLPYAEAVFDIEYFRQHPEPFYVLAQELYPGKFHPTVSHAFIALLARKGLLQMLFTQNIDCLERAAGVPADKIVEAHGSFATQRCIECKGEFPDDKMREHVFDGKVPHCADTACNGIVKPDIVFFGESLPPAFGQNSYITAMADLVLIIGTSLTVYPFAGLPEMAREGKPRVLFNMERVGRVGGRTDDVVELGPCDDGIRTLANALGWREELEKLWRDVVGEEEAKRQLQSQERQDAAIDDEMQKLAEGVEAALNFDEVKMGPEDDANKHGDMGTTGRDAPPPDYREQDSVPSSPETPEKTAVAGKAGPGSSPVKASGEPKNATTTEPGSDERKEEPPSTTTDAVEHKGEGKLDSSDGDEQKPPL
ncbi:sir2 family protein [Hirsutella rhossiliensis]|uniref:Sir2 family domain-containing protein n=1 Tax=Hirsutella rhossiliensis TaxID=111463 RepID=A0A9P8SHR9_9HYPO|nr:sir2 family domain-containing protein [Hirsutella rhossiliensis]KAH0961850.1 sir2 family domain-containing protein [Hirsutella rhossiliensis]